MSNTFTKTSLRGFTLIELLVVIAIIGLLSTAIMGPVQTGLKKGRDTRKISDITQIQGALLQYAGDNNGSYPVYLVSNVSTSTLASTTPTYMVPDDKMSMTLSAARDRFMYVTYGDLAGNIVSYHLGVALENQNASLQGDADCAMNTTGALGAGPAVPPINLEPGQAWGAMDGNPLTTVPPNDPSLKACITIDTGTGLLNSNAWSLNNSNAGNNYLTAPLTGAVSSEEDFGGAGTQEAAGQVCSSKLDTCIFDITPN